MGYGDEIMGSGMARGAAARGARIAFGDGRRVIWHTKAAEMFRGNPNVVPPGTKRNHNVEWIDHYPGRRRYCRLHISRNNVRHWLFTPQTQRIGEIFFDDQEARFAESMRPGFVLIESSVKHTAGNKQWPVERYAQVANTLRADGHRVLQFNGGLAGVPVIQTPNFRMAAAALSRASVYVGPEGGLHHAAAALGVPGVVIFGGFISPEVTGYDIHTNLFTGYDLGCGMIDKCEHCQRAMKNISVDQVINATREIIHEASQTLQPTEPRGTSGAVSSERADVRRWPDVPTPQVAGDVAAHQELPHSD